MAQLDSGWTRRLFEGTGAGPVRVGLALAGGGIAIFLLQEVVLGRFSAEHFGGIWIAIAHILVTSYLLSAYTIAEQSRDRCIESLRPSLAEELTAPLLSTRPGERRLLLVSSVAGVLISGWITLYVSPGPASFDPRTWSPENGWHRVIAPFMGFWTSRLAGSILLESRRLSALAGTLREIDLLDPTRLDPFGRQALTNALLVIGSVAVYALFIVDDVGYASLVSGLLVASLAVGGLALWLPLRGVRERVREAKARELAWCREEMRRARAKLAETGPDDRGSLASLVAWEARVAAVNEWTLDASAFARFALYLLIPLGSWAGGALVERVIDSLLD